MNMRIQNLYLFIIAVILLCSLSCNNSSKENGRIQVDYDKKLVFIWEDNIRIDTVIPLGNADSISLGFTNKCFITDELIIYYDQTQDCVFAFDHSGQLQYKIDDRGMGDKEYINIKDICLSYDKENILVLDNSSVLAYNIKNGQLEDRIYLSPNLCSNFYMFINPHRDQFIFWTTDKDISLYAYDGQNYKVIQERDGFYFVSQKFYEFPTDKYNLIADYGRFKISSLRDNAIVPKYEFDFGKYNFPERLIPENNQEFNIAEDAPYFRSILKAFEVDDCLYMNTLSPDGDLYNIIYDKNKHRITSGIQDSKSPFTIVSTYQQWFVGIIYPAYFSDESVFNKYIDKTQEDKENPIIVLLKFK